MTASALIDVGTLLRPFAAWLADATGQPVGDNRAPLDGDTGAIVDPPYSVAHTASNVSSETGSVRWVVLVRSVGGTTKGQPVAEQARLLGDKNRRAISDQDYAGRYLTELPLPGVRVLSRESNGDGHEEPGDQTDEWVESFTLTVQPV